MEVVVPVMWVVMFVMMMPNALGAQHNCGYDSCPRGEPGMLNVHLVPHTHDDVGWLKTVDQYYYGSRNEIQRAGVQYILDSVIKELLTDPSKRFIYVETAFLWRWYRQQDSQTRAAVADLVNQGRLEFIGGGWSMNDEACTHYNAIIDQMSLGMRLLRDNFGPCGVPRVAWQIDPFGHSKEQANLFAQMGFDGYFFGRLDYDDKDRRMNDTEMEMVWLASPDLGQSSELFTGALYNNYAPPPGHCYDISCSDAPIMDDPRLKGFNVNDKVDNFISYVNEQSKAFRTNHVLITMGEDFNYQDANMWFKNMDKLIKYVNLRQRSGVKVNAFYSTPSCYLKALHDSNLVWPTKEDDFMPYASDPWAYWTGYYTSRPAQKRLIRQSNNFLQICKQMSTLFQTEDMSISPTRVDYLRHAMGVNQHHDAVTGTEKQHVANDYIQRLSEATNICHGPINDAFTGAGAPAQEFCGRLNVSECHVSEQQQKFVVYLYNPLARVRSHWVRLPVVTRNYIVMDPDGKQVVHQVTPLSDAVMRLPGRTSKAKYELIFKATGLPPLGFKGFFVMRMRYSKPSSQSVVKEGQYGLFGDTAYLHVNPPTRQVVKVGSPAVDLNVKPSFMWYKGYGDVNGSKWNAQQRPSGAYVFHPEGQAELFDVKAVRAVEGALCSEFQQSYADDWVAQTVRVYSGEPYIEVDWIVGPIPIKDGVTKEIVLRYNSNIASGDEFYTDSNGRQMMKRKRNHRNTWKLNVTEPVTGNYYPVNSRIFIQDKHLQLTVLNDRSQGGSSLNSGQLELMLHRRTVQDDGFGVGEALNETEFDQGLVVRGRHLILISNVDDAPRLHRQLAEEMFMSPLVSFVATPHMTAKQWRQNPGITTQFEGASALPDNVHLLTLEMYRPGEILVRLEHQYQSNEDHILSKPVTVNLMELFHTLKLISLKEFGLAADRPLAEIDRLRWNHAKSSRLQWYLRQPLPQSAHTHQKHASFMITLKPMQIRTFVIQYSYKASRFQQRF